MKLTQFLVAAALLAESSSAIADSRVFIVANQPDGYGIDQCLASGESCGAPAANAYCEANAYRAATAYRRLDPRNVTDAIPGEKCSGPACAVAYVAITCER